jgi:hypothetical protein
MIDVQALLTNADFKHIELPEAEPPQLPVTILDIDRAKYCYSMDHFMADMCPNCGGNNMQLGDYVCWGMCYVCAKPGLGEY